MSRPLTFNLFNTSALVNDTVHDTANDVRSTMGSECEGLLSRIQKYASSFDAINSQAERRR